MYLDKDIYSDSVVLNAISVCNLLFQIIGQPENNILTKVMQKIVSIFAPAHLLT